MRKAIYSLTVFLALILMVSGVSYATSIKTKLFFKDLKKVQKHFDKQQKMIIQVLDTLTDDDIKLIKKASESSYGSKEYYNNLKQIDDFELRDLLKKNDKLQYGYNKNYKEASFRNVGLMNHSLPDLFWYDAILIGGYKIPKEDYDEVLDKYSEFLIDVLDKTQTLREKAEERGLIGYPIPKEDKSKRLELPRNPISVFLVSNEHDDKRNKDTKGSLSSMLYSRWAEPSDGRGKEFQPVLYSNKNMLIAQKLWLEYILNNDIIRSCCNYEEKVMVEIERMDKRLAKLGGKETVKKKITSSIKLKLFLKDLRKVQKHFDKQQKMMIQVLDTLTDDDIKLLKKANESSYRSKEYYNNLKQIDDFELRDLLKKNDKLQNDRIKNLKKDTLEPVGLVKSRLTELFWYKQILFRQHAYAIPKEDYDEALDKYSEFLIDVLDKTQTLREKAEERGLIGYPIPKEEYNKLELPRYSTIPVFLVSSEHDYKGNEDAKNTLTRMLYTYWADPTYNKEFQPILYSNKNILMAHKLWLEYILNNDIINSCCNYEEKVMVEIERMDKRLAKLGGTAKVKKPKAPEEQKPAETSTEKSKPIAKPKFKLDLPK